jgi:hypothetical protein
LVAEADPHHFKESTPTMNDATLPLPGLSPIFGKALIARFDGDLLSSDAGVLALRAVEDRLGVADRLAGCINDPRAQDQVIHRAKFSMGAPSRLLIGRRFSLRRG